MTTIGEHTIDLSLLPESAHILDLGCRGFDFTNHFKNLGHNVFSVDCDLLKGADYYWLAITDRDGLVGIERNSDPQGTRIKEGSEVMGMKLESFSKLAKVDFWDVIKFDIEGAEYQVIMSLTEAPAKQLSIEFHTHTGIYGTREVERMEKKLYQLGYKQIQHKKEARHGLQANWWDSLFVLE